MQYISTRGGGSPVSFEDALLKGLAPDGGLYMPSSWPGLPKDWQAEMANAPYTDFATLVASAFTGRDDDALHDLVRQTYAGFDDPEVAPLRKLEDGLYLLELFHGPTFAFKDFAMQMLARLFDEALTARGERRTIVVATSGDTGAAAVEAFAGLAAIDLFVMHPKGLISAAQRRQMTTCTAPNVRNMAITGTFDDCQTALKALFADDDFREDVKLGAVNSINWARIVAQTAYYLFALARLGQPADFSVPTGNFGDIFAGFVAKQMGAETGPLLIATNENNILHRALKTGTYAVTRAVPTLSPAMDIQIASNFERLLFEALGRDADALKGLMANLSTTGEMVLPEAALSTMRSSFLSDCVSNEETKAEIARANAEYGVLIDPHTAVGLCAARRSLKADGLPHVVLSTAHPAKFADTVEGAAGKAPELPAKLHAMMDAEERYDELSPDADAVKKYVRAHI